MFKRGLFLIRLPHMLFVRNSRHVSITLARFYGASEIETFINVEYNILEIFVKKYLFTNNLNNVIRKVLGEYLWLLYFHRR